MQPPKLPSGLPAPDAESLAHSELVADFVRERIDDAGGISFGEYMHHALYAPGLGYYVSGSVKFSEAGDFVTAPEVSPLFGHIVARQIEPVLDTVGERSILELGAGSGALAVSVLRRLCGPGSPPLRYRILEVSAELVARQRRRIARDAPELEHCVEWVDAPPERFEGVVLANEVADALPVERFRIGPAGTEQAYVVAGGDRRLASEWRPATGLLAASVEALGIALPPGFESEISLGLKAWVGDLLRSLDRGLLLLIDYGLPRREYYAPDRSGGWLRCHFRHHVHDDPLVLPGIQDISSWVDFTSVAEAASERGAAVAGFVTQAMFLLAGGLENEFSTAAAESPRRRAELAGAVKRLTLPTEMGENFKCIGLTKGSVPVPAALSAADRAQTL